MIVLHIILFVIVAFCIAHVTQRTIDFLSEHNKWFKD